MSSGFLPYVNEDFIKAYSVSMTKELLTLLFFISHYVLELFISKMSPNKGGKIEDRK